MKSLLKILSIKPVLFGIALLYLANIAPAFSQEEISLTYMHELSDVPKEFIVHDPAIIEQVAIIIRNASIASTKLEAFRDMTDFRFTLIYDDTVNAYIKEDGIVRLHTGLLDFIIRNGGNAGWLAGADIHELGHWRHEDMTTKHHVAARKLIESRCDRFSVMGLIHSIYHPYDIGAFWDALEREKRSGIKETLLGIISSHPDPHQRSFECKSNASLARDKFDVPYPNEAPERRVPLGITVEQMAQGSALKNILKEKGYSQERNPVRKYEILLDGLEEFIERKGKYKISGDSKNSIRHFKQEALNLARTLSPIHLIAFKNRIERMRRFSSDWLSGPFIREIRTFIDVRLGDVFFDRITRVPESTKNIPTSLAELKLKLKEIGEYELVKRFDAAPYVPVNRLYRRYIREALSSEDLLMLADFAQSLNGLEIKDPVFQSNSARIRVATYRMLISRFFEVMPFETAVLAVRNLYNSIKEFYRSPLIVFSAKTEAAINEAIDRVMNRVNVDLTKAQAFEMLVELDGFFKEDNHHRKYRTREKTPKFAEAAIRIGFKMQEAALSLECEEIPSLRILNNWFGSEWEKALYLCKRYPDINELFAVSGFSSEKRPDTSFKVDPSQFLAAMRNTGYVHEGYAPEEIMKRLATYAAAYVRYDIGAFLFRDSMIEQEENVKGSENRDIIKEALAKMNSPQERVSAIRKIQLALTALKPGQFASEDEIAAFNNRQANFLHYFYWKYYEDFEVVVKATPAWNQFTNEAKEKLKSVKGDKEKEREVGFDFIRRSGKLFRFFDTPRQLLLWKEGACRSDTPMSSLLFNKKLAITYYDALTEIGLDSEAAIKVLSIYLPESGSQKAFALDGSRRWLEAIWRMLEEKPKWEKFTESRDISNVIPVAKVHSENFFNMYEDYLHTVGLAMDNLQRANPNDPNDKTDYYAESAKLILFLIDKIEKPKDMERFLHFFHHVWSSDIKEKANDFFAHRKSRGNLLLGEIHNALIAKWRSDSAFQDKIPSRKFYIGMVGHPYWKDHTYPSETSDRFFNQELRGRLSEFTVVELKELLGEQKREIKKDRQGNIKDVRRSDKFKSRFADPELRNDVIIEVIDQRWSDNFSRALAFIRNVYPNACPLRDQLLDNYAKSRALTRDQLEKVDSMMRGRKSQEFSTRDMTGYHIFTQIFKELKPAERVHLLLWLSDMRELNPGDNLYKIIDRILTQFSRTREGSNNLLNPGYVKELYFSPSITNEERSKLIAQLFVGEHSIYSDTDASKHVRDALTNLANDSDIFRRILSAYYDQSDPHERILFISYLFSDIALIKDKPALVAKRILEAIPIFGPKIGQILSAQEGLVPDSYREAFTSFFDRVESMPKYEAIKLLETYMGVDPFTVFAEIGEEVGSASVKVVYRGKLRDGAPVVIKIQREALLHKIEQTIRMLRNMIDGMSAEGKLGEFASMVEFVVNMMEKTLKREADFNIERESAHEHNRRKPILKIYKNDLEVAFTEPVDELSNEFVLVEKEIDYAVKLSDYDKENEERRKRGEAELTFNEFLREKIGVEPKVFITSLWREVAREIFVSGLIDPDRHRGNDFVSSEFLVFIDLGQTFKLTPDERLDLIELMRMLGNEKAEPSDVLNSWSKILNLEKQEQRDLWERFVQEFNSESNNSLDLLFELLRETNANNIPMREHFYHLFNLLTKMKEFNSLMGTEGLSQNKIAGIIRGASMRGYFKAKHESFLSKMQTALEVLSEKVKRAFGIAGDSEKLKDVETEVRTGNRADESFELKHAGVPLGSEEGKALPMATLIGDENDKDYREGERNPAGGDVTPPEVVDGRREKETESIVLSQEYTCKTIEEVLKLKDEYFEKGKTLRIPMTEGKEVLFHPDGEYLVMYGPKMYDPKPKKNWMPKIPPEPGVRLGKIQDGHVEWNTKFRITGLNENEIFTDPKDQRGLFPREWLESKDGARPAGLIVDLGSGEGTLIEWLRRNGYENVLGIDAYITDAQEKSGLFRADMLESLKSLPNASIDLAISLRGPYAEGVDFVSSQTITPRKEEQIKKHLKPLFETLQRKLVPGGRAIISGLCYPDNLIMLAERFGFQVTRTASPERIEFIEESGFRGYGAHKPYMYIEVEKPREGQKIVPFVKRRSQNYLVSTVSDLDSLRKAIRDGLILEIKDANTLVSRTVNGYGLVIKIEKDTDKVLLIGKDAGSKTVDVFKIGIYEFREQADGSIQIKDRPISEQKVSPERLTTFLENTGLKYAEEGFSMDASKRITSTDREIAQSGKMGPPEGGSARPPSETDGGEPPDILGGMSVADKERVGIPPGQNRLEVPQSDRVEVENLIRDTQSDEVEGGSEEESAKRAEEVEHMLNKVKSEVHEFNLQRMIDEARSQSNKTPVVLNQGRAYGTYIFGQLASELFWDLHDKNYEHMGDAIKYALSTENLAQYNLFAGIMAVQNKIVDKAWPVSMSQMGASLPPRYVLRRYAAQHGLGMAAAMWMSGFVQTAMETGSLRVAANQYFTTDSAVSVGLSAAGFGLARMPINLWRYNWHILNTTAESRAAMQGLDLAEDAVRLRRLGQALETAAEVNRGRKVAQGLGMIAKLRHVLNFAETNPISILPALAVEAFVFTASHAMTRYIIPAYDKFKAERALEKALNEVTYKMYKPGINEKDLKAALVSLTGAIDGYEKATIWRKLLENHAKDAKDRMILSNSGLIAEARAKDSSFDYAIRERLQTDPMLGLKQLFGNNEYKSIMKSFELTNEADEIFRETMANNGPYPISLTPESDGTMSREDESAVLENLFVKDENIRSETKWVICPNDDNYEDVQREIERNTAVNDGPLDIYSADVNAGSSKGPIYQTILWCHIKEKLDEQDRKAYGHSVSPFLKGMGYGQWEMRDEAKRFVTTYSKNGNVALPKTAYGARMFHRIIMGFYAEEAKKECEAANIREAGSCNENVLKIIENWEDASIAMKNVQEKAYKAFLNGEFSLNSDNGMSPAQLVLSRGTSN